MPDKSSSADGRALVCPRINDGGGLADCFEGLARIAASARGDKGRARRPPSKARPRVCARYAGRRPIRADLRPPVVPDAALAEGRAMTLEDAVEDALEVAASVAGGSTNVDPD